MRLAPLFVLLVLLGSAAPAQIEPQAFHDFAFRQHPGATLPLDAALRDESGRPVTLGQMFGDRPAVVVLEYLKCSNLCGLVLRGAVQAMRQGNVAPGRDVSLVAISIDPRDTPADAAAARAMYSRLFSGTAIAANGIHFLTGSPDQVARIASAEGFPYRYDRRTGQFAHPAGFVMVTPSGRISRYMLGLNPSADDLKSAVAEASRGEIRRAAHPLLLLCFGYDPEPGSVAALVMRLVRGVSAAVFLGCVLLIAFLARRRTA
jgi:protein SCO1